MVVISPVILPIGFGAPAARLYPFPESYPEQSKLLSKAFSFAK
jgi:hypothetical protein